MSTENLSTLKIYKLTQEQYERKIEAGDIEENAIYLTPDEDINLGLYATVEELNKKADKKHNHVISDVADLGVALDNKVSTSTTVNGKALSGNITLSASDVGAASSSHTHDEYASSSHTHSEYANSKHSHTISDVADLSDVLNAKADSNHTHSEYAASSHNHELSDVSGLNDSITDIINRLNTLEYKPISITSFSNNVNTVELGTTVNSVTLTWAMNKTPSTLTLDGTSIDTSLKSYTYNDLALKPTSVTTKTYTLKATDEKNSSSKSTSINFYNGVYYGKLNPNNGIDSAAILTMSKKIQNSKGVEFTTTTGAGEYIAYACPKRLGTATFTVGVLQGGFQEPVEVNFTNSLGYSETYYLYLSTNPNLGAITVKVS